jgi:hypothetical protein
LPSPIASATSERLRENRRRSKTAGDGRKEQLGVLLLGRRELRLDVPLEDGHPAARAPNPRCPWTAEMKPYGSLGNWLTEREAGIAVDRATLFYDVNAKRNFTHHVPPADAATLRLESRRAFKQRTSSRYRGVCWIARRQKWQASIRANGHPRSLGYFADELTAAAAYDAAATRLHGTRAALNFAPNRDYAPRPRGA